MKKAQVIFEVTAEKTQVVAIGLTGNTIKTDITGTDIEKQFVSLLKKIRERESSTEIEKALDIDTWKEQAEPVSEVKPAPPVQQLTCQHCGKVLTGPSIPATHDCIQN